MKHTRFSLCALVFASALLPTIAIPSRFNSLMSPAKLETLAIGT